MTYAIYVKDPNHGWHRLGVFRCKRQSVYCASQAFWKRYPNAAKAFDGTNYQIAGRFRLMGRYVDGERLPMDAPE